VFGHECCDCHNSYSSGGLTFDTLRTVNVQRCTDPSAFNHKLDSWSSAEWTNAMAGELGEVMEVVGLTALFFFVAEGGKACNIAKKMIRHRDGVAGNKGADLDMEALKAKPASELADVLIYADLVAASQGIDLGEAVRATFNKKSEELGAKERL